jgi:hypothetical protein
MTSQPMTPQEAIESLGLTVESVFVPFSQSRNKDAKLEGFTVIKDMTKQKAPHYTLNWRVTLKRNGRDILTTDYSAGIAHCPSYKIKPPQQWDRPAKDWEFFATEWECEHGKAAGYSWSGFYPKKGALPLLAAPLDVIHSLVMESDAIDYPTYEEWSSCLGYDPDSRSGEATYRACLEIALKLRAAIGDDGLATLREAFAEY